MSTEPHAFFIKGVDSIFARSPVLDAAKATDTATAKPVQPKLMEFAVPLHDGTTVRHLKEFLAEALNRDIARIGLSLFTEVNPNDDDVVVESLAKFIKMQDDAIERGLVDRSTGRLTREHFYTSLPETEVKAIAAGDKEGLQKLAVDICAKVPHSIFAISPVDGAVDVAWLNMVNARPEVMELDLTHKAEDTVDKVLLATIKENEFRGMPLPIQNMTWAQVLRASVLFCTQGDNSMAFLKKGDTVKFFDKDGVAIVEPASTTNAAADQHGVQEPSELQNAAATVFESAVVPGSVTRDTGASFVQGLARGGGDSETEVSTSVVRNVESEVADDSHSAAELAHDDTAPADADTDSDGDAASSTSTAKPSAPE